MIFMSIDWNEESAIYKRLTRLLKDGKKKVSVREAASMLSEEFGVDCTENCVRGVLKRKKAREGDPVVEQRHQERNDNVFRWSDDRISFLKQAYKTGVSYGTISGQFYERLGIQVSVDQVRRAIYKYTTISEREEADTARELLKDNVVEEIGEVEDELTVEECIGRDKDLMRIKAQRDRAEKKYVALLKDQIFMEHIIDTLRETIVAMPRVTIPPMPKIKSRTSVGEKAILMISDAHVGEVVDVEQTRGIAQYNFDIFRRRVQYLSDKVVDLLKNKLKGYNFEEIHVAMLGDMISGNIHEELMMTNEYTVIESVHGAAIIMAQFLADMARQFPKVVVPCVVGNHGRMMNKPSAKNRYVNWDFVFYNMVSLLLQNQKNIEFIIPKSFYMIHKIFDFNALLMHGDYGINGGFAGIPFYGVQRASFRLSELLNKEEELLDLIMMGHFHSLTTLDRVHGGSIMMNGSIIGGTEYSVGKMFTSNQPKQMLFGVHPEKGKTWQYDINLSFAPVSGPCRYKYNNKGSLISQLIDEGAMGEFPLM